MALRDQPYLPLYIQDFLTDEKLAECSASATGVYIRIMCLMHKSEHYGKLLLKQKHKQTGKQIEDFALMLGKQLPYDSACIVGALTELLEENVLYIEAGFLIQKRMVKDNNLSVKRSETGSLGGKKTQQKLKEFAKPKVQPNAEYENVIDNIEFNWGKESSDFLNDKIWIEQVCMTKSVPIAKLKKSMQHFITDLTLKQDFKPIKDIRSHYLNYFNKHGLNGATKSSIDENELESQRIVPEQYFTEQ